MSQQSVIVHHHYIHSKSSGVVVDTDCVSGWVVKRKIWERRGMPTIKDECLIHDKIIIRKQMEPLSVSGPRWWWSQAIYNPPYTRQKSF